MTEYKVEVKGKILVTSLDTRLNPGDDITVEDPAPSLLEELEKLENMGEIRLVELEEQSFPPSVEEVDDETTSSLEEEEIEEEGFELIGTDEKFDCTICGRNHYADSEIGKEHLEEMLEEKDLEEIEILD